jgi:type I restriction enzyme R subunit
MPIDRDYYNEADTRAKLIDPAIHAKGWTEDLIRREESAPPIQFDGNLKPRRKGRGRVDYLLRVKVNPDTQPVAVALIEAKKENLPPAHGLEQAKAYATCKRLNIPFVFSSNGHLFVEFNNKTGITSQPKPLSEFPTPQQLRQFYENAKGIRLDSELAKPLLVKYTGGEATRRYYQDAAIRAVLEKIAQGGKRALLSLATGSGKTFIAVNLLKRIADAGQLKRALFVCDRTELREQGLGAFQNIFGSDAASVYLDSDGKNHARNARIHVATYQTLNVDNDEADANFLISNYPENYFSHIVIDECHRSAWGKWSCVLKRNDKAIQVGLTATPRQLQITANTQEAEQDKKITADNYNHFGEPVYEYDLMQGIEDGYLAACDLQKGRVNLDETGITIEELLNRNPRDAITGKPVTAEELKERYEKTEYEDRILLPDRVIAMCADLFKYLIASGNPEQKTIIYCARDRHADDVAAEMNNLYARWCRDNNRERKDHYAFKCTCKSNGNDFLPEFKASNQSHFIATTVDLLTTGVDVPCVRNIVFFKYVRSPISFYQMVGRGTRIHEPTGKLMFTVYDYTDASKLFGEEFVTRKQSTGGGGGGGGTEQPPSIIVDGFDVHISDQGRYVITEVDGKAMPVTVEEYKEKLSQRLVKELPSLNKFINCWIEPEDRRALIDDLVKSGYSPTVVQRLEDMISYDLYDVLAYLGYGLVPRTRTDRASAFVYKNNQWLNALPANTCKTLKAMTNQFAIAGTEGLENPNIFRIPEVRLAGGLEALKIIGEPAQVLHQTKERIFAV